MRRIISFSIYIFIITFSYSQDLFFNGYVFEQQSGEPVANVLVHVLSNNRTCYTDSYGYFNIKIEKGHQKIICSSYGYKKDTINFFISDDTTVTINLKSYTDLDKVIIKGERNYLKTPIMGVESINQKQVQLIPAIGSETDIIKVYQLLPGVVSGNEGTSGLLVRGGSSDQTLFILDDVPLYYVNHLGGFVSAFNNDIINNVTFYKGSFPARFGGRLSSVFDVSMKNGNFKKFSGNLSFGLAVSRFSLQGPIVKNKISYLFSFRTMPIGWLIAPISKIGLEDVSLYYTFYDLNQKLTYIVNNKNRLFFSFYKGNDLFHIKYAPRDTSNRFLSIQKWGNTLFSFRWNHIYNSFLFSNMNIYYTKFNNSFNFDSYNNIDTLSNYKYKRDIDVNDIGVNFKLDYSIQSFFKIKTGADIVFHCFNPGYVKCSTNNTDLDTLISNVRINALENVFYLENLFDFRFIAFNIGVRVSSYWGKTMFYPVIEPRISLRFDIAENLFFKASLSKNTQYVHSLSGLNEVDMPADYWLPSTNIIKPEKNQQFALGIYKKSRNFQFSLECYYKKFNNLIETKEGKTLFSIDYADWQKNIEVNGKGKSYGIELMIKKTEGILSGWIAYSHSRSFRQFKNINLGRVYPFKYDRPNSLNIVAIYKLNKKIDFSAIWVYGTGYPYTKPKSYASLIDNVGSSQFSSYLIWDLRNSSRMKDYHRLDLSVNYTKKTDKNVKRWSVNIYNVYSRLNPYYYDVENNFDTRNKIYTWRIAEFILFPIIPSVSYSIKF